MRASFVCENPTIRIDKRGLQGSDVEFTRDGELKVNGNLVANNCHPVRVAGVNK